MMRNTNVEELVMRRIIVPAHPQDSFVEVARVEHVGSLQTERILQERVLVQVSSAQDDDVDLLGGSIDEEARPAFDALQQRFLGDRWRPVEARGL
jgi:hypothetical protein